MENCLYGQVGKLRWPVREAYGSKRTVRRNRSMKGGMRPALSFLSLDGLAPDRDLRRVRSLKTRFASC